MGKRRRPYNVDSQPTACRLPADVRRMLDWVALVAGAESTSDVMRAFIEQGLTGLGFELRAGVTAVQWPERDNVRRWVTQNQAR